MDLSDVIAVMALVISGIALYKQLKKDKVSQNTIFFKEIFFNFLNYVGNFYNFQNLQKKITVNLIF